MKLRPIRSMKSSRLRIAGVVCFLVMASVCSRADPEVTHPALVLRKVLSAGPVSRPIRLTFDPRTAALHYLKLDGSIHRVDPVPAGGGFTNRLVHSPSEHGITNATGMVFGPDGTLYLVGNFNTEDGNRTWGTLRRGVPQPDGGRTWTVVASTVPYPRSRTAYDHVCNGIAISPDGTQLLVNSGSRTDHGEVQTLSGLFPETREVGLTACILRIPAGSTDLILPDDRAALREAGFLYAEGVRNTYDMAFAPNGDLIGTENGPDRDMAEELNWLRPGRHYGFPWRIGGQDNPQQFPDYDPAADLLLNPAFGAVIRGYYHNDPTFPPVPVPFTEPIVNLGPDADSYRDNLTGEIRDASDRGETLSTFTSHRSPLGIVFDGQAVLSPEFRGHGFIASWTAGDPSGSTRVGPFRDPGQDVLHVVLEKTADGENYTARCIRIAGGFVNPIDTELVGNRLYVLEYSGDRNLWEIVLPREAAGTLGVVDVASRTLKLQGERGRTFRIESSDDLTTWRDLLSLPPDAGELTFSDPAEIPDRRYYRAVAP